MKKISLTPTKELLEIVSQHEKSAQNGVSCFGKVFRDSWKELKNRRVQEKYAANGKFENE